ncbi:MAG TPA: acyl-homoserine-lactone synthase [Devosia sp.]|nr:acyl-homoserine-lactone synthase [Devosia sp.]
MQFQFVTRANEHLFQPELEQFFRARHTVYAEELGWVPCSPDGLEYDAFDTAHAAYLIVMDGDEFVAGSRLVPTHLPHMLSEVFPSICTVKPMVRDALVVEWTRGFVVPGRREGAGLVLKAQCCAAVMEYCLSQGYRQVGGIQDAKWLAIWKRMGWTVHVHGDRIDISGEDWLPAYFDVTEAALAGARRWGKLTGPVLTNDVNLGRAA